MKFAARISKVGINPYVDVPARIVKQFGPAKGYIRVKGLIEKHEFYQTLVPVRTGGKRVYRLYVNGPMLRGAHIGVGDRAEFDIALNNAPRKLPPVPPILTERLREEGLSTIFRSLTPSRKLEILRYLGNLKSKETVLKNVERVVRALKGREEVPYVRR